MTPGFFGQLDIHDFDQCVLNVLKRSKIVGFKKHGDDLVQPKWKN